MIGWAGMGKGFLVDLKQAEEAWTQNNKKF